MNRELTAALRAVHQAGVPFDVSQAQRMAGMYRLLGHDQPQVRQLAGDMCKAFGVIETVEDFDEVSGLGALLDEWVRMTPLCVFGMHVRLTGN